MAFTVVYDACVLFPAPLRDFDAEGRPRFVYIQIQSFHFGASETLFALNTAGAVVAQHASLPARQYVRQL